MPHEPRLRRPLRVALYSGIVVRADAISGSVRTKLQIIRGLAGAGEPVSATVFTQACDTAEPEVVQVRSVGDLISDARFRGADVHVFEFGIHYELFNAVFLVPPEQAVIAVYHNITPPSLVEEDQRPAIERSLTQKNNLFRADRIACVSEYDRDDLVAFGIPPERLTVLHLPPAVIAPARAGGSSDTVEFLCVGRLVPAKGVLDLARAVVALRRRGEGGFRVTVAGNQTFSSPACLAEIERLTRDNSLEGYLRVILSPDDGRLGALYAESDALVVPSHHEGYCLPVIEALAAGCYVIAYDATNLPHITAGLGTLVPPGDVEGLADAMSGFIAESVRARHQGEAPRLPLGAAALAGAAWQKAVAEHLRGYSADAYRRGFVELLEWAAALPAGAKPAAGVPGGNGRSLLAARS